MKLYLLTAALILAVGMTGCQPDISPSPGLGDPYPAPINDPQISVLSPDLRPWLGFHPAVVVKDGRSPMQVEVPVRNLTNKQYLIEYRMLFYNRAGQELSPVMGWEMAPLDPKQTCARSPSGGQCPRS
jgi:hypothetical protein